MPKTVLLLLSQTPQIISFCLCTQEGFHATYTQAELQMKPLREPPPQHNVSENKHAQLIWSNFRHVRNKLLFPRNSSASFGSYVSLEVNPPTEALGIFPEFIALRVLACLRDVQQFPGTQAV